MAIQLTERAAQEVKTICESQKLDLSDTYLKLGVKGGGCSGFSYTLDLVAEKGEQDKEWEIEGVKVIVDPKSNLYLDGTTLDFKEDLTSRGFDFQNPNTTSCGCGSSFCPSGKTGCEGVKRNV